MNILHILSQIQPTGAEYYAAALGDWQIGHGHRVFIISDDFFAKSDAEIIKYQVHNRKFWNRFFSDKYLLDFLKKNKIDIVHSHSRAAAKIASKALKHSIIPLISTVHGRQHIHFSSKRTNPFGERIIAVCENLKTHLINDLGFKSRIDVIPNPFNCSEYELITPEETNFLTLTLIGRTTAQKGKRAGEFIENVLPYLLENISNLKIRIVGGKPENLPECPKKLFYELQNKYPDRIETPGFVSSIKEEIYKAKVVIASGRAAIESILSGRQTLALGESSYIGTITSCNFSEAVKSNFGDSAVAFSDNLKLDYEAIKKDITDALTNPIDKKINQAARDYYDLNKIAESIEEIYLSERMRKVHPGYIPVLLYHQVTDKPLKSKHKIFITQIDFEKQVKSLKSRGKTPITFREYYQFRIGELDIKNFPKKPIVLTFDDGYKDNYENLLPILQKYLIKCVIFALGDRNIRSNVWDTVNGELSSPLMNKDELKAMSAAGVEIGAHSMTHSDFTKLNDKQLEYETAFCKSELEKQLGEIIYSYSYPFGVYDERSVEAVRNAGFKFGIATDHGELHWEDSLFRIFRPNIFQHQGLFSFLKKSSPHYRIRFYKKRGR